MFHRILKKVLKQNEPYMYKHVLWNSVSHLSVASFLLSLIKCVIYIILVNPNVVRFFYFRDCFGQVSNTLPYVGKSQK